MGVFDAFFILFKSNADEAVKDNEKVKTSNDRLEESFNKTAKQANVAQQYFSQLIRSLVGVATSAFSVYTILNGLRSAINYDTALGKTARLMNVNIETLDAWSNAAVHAGGSAEGFQASLKALAGHLGGSTAVALAVLPRLADSFHRLGQYQAFRYGRMLGLDDATILLLSRGRRELEEIIKRQKELGVVTKQDQEISLKFNSELADTGHGLRSLYNTFAMDILPVLSEFLHKIQDITIYLRQHKDLVIGALVGMGLAAAFFAAPIILANASLLIMIAIVGALIAVFAIAYEDIKFYLEGQDSLLGRLIKKWPLLGEVVKSVVSAIKSVLEALSHPLEKLENLFNRIVNLRANKTLAENLGYGQEIVGQAVASNLNSSTVNSIFGGSQSNRENTVNVGDITINTQATDATGIARELTTGIFQKQLRQINDFHADGVAY